LDPDPKLGGIWDPDLKKIVSLVYGSYIFNYCPFSVVLYPVFVVVSNFV
jgi:hypothetical protein